MRTFAHLCVLALIWLPLVWQLDALLWLGDLYEKKQIHPFNPAVYQPIYYIIYTCALIRGACYLLAAATYPKMFQVKGWLFWALIFFEIANLLDYHFYFGQTPYRVEISILYTGLLTWHYLAYYWTKFYYYES